VEALGSEIQERILTKTLLVKDLQQNTIIEDIFAVASASAPRLASSGNWFISMVMSDSSGQIKTTYWGSPDETAIQTIFQQLTRGSVVVLKGSVKKAYSGSGSEISVSIRDGDYLRLLNKGEYKCDCFLPLTKRDRRKMVAKIQNYVSSITDPYLKKLLDAFFNDNEFLSKFVDAPAGKVQHGACVGGLLEHTLDVVDSCEGLSKVYGAINRDLLIAGALLHDIGKIEEYSMNTTIDFTDNCILCGHVVTGARMVSNKCDELAIPPDYGKKIAHMVLASHGKREHGAPVEPTIPEAEILSAADDLDAHLNNYFRVYEENEGKEDDMYVYDRVLGRYVYLK